MLIQNNSSAVRDTHGWICKRYDGFDALPLSYNDLFESGGKQSFDLDRDWFGHLANTALEEKDKVLLYGVESQHTGDPVALLLLRYSESGTVLTSLSNYYSSLFYPLFKAGEAGSLAYLLKTVKSAPERWSVLKLFPMPHEQPVYEQTLNALKSSGWRSFQYFCFGNWYLPIADRSFDVYWQGLSSKLRNTVARKRKKFLACGGRVEVVSGGAAIEQAINAYQKVYHASWKKPEPFPEFIPGLIRQLADKGDLRLGLAWIENEPVAAQIWLVGGGRACIYKLAYDEQFAKFSAGSILTAHLMQHVIDVDRVQEVDYLSGDDEYKQQWMSHRRERWGVIAYNPATVSGFLGMSAQYFRRSVKWLLGKG